MLHTCSRTSYKTRKREHSRKPDELYEIIEKCSPGPYLELFARGQHSPNWRVWGDQSSAYHPHWPTYKNHSGARPVLAEDGAGASG